MTDIRYEIGLILEELDYSTHKNGEGFWVVTVDVTKTENALVELVEKYVEEAVDDAEWHRTIGSE